MHYKYTEKGKGPQTKVAGGLLYCLSKWLEFRMFAKWKTCITRLLIVQDEECVFQVTLCL